MMNAAPVAPIEFDARAEGPLAGVRVLDLSRLVAGNMPRCSSLISAPT